jgi:hypothetical protein
MILTGRLRGILCDHGLFGSRGFFGGSVGGIVNTSERTKQIALAGALVLALLPVTAAGSESNLTLRFWFEYHQGCFSDWISCEPGCPAFADEATAVRIRIWMINETESPVTEGSSELGESLQIEVVNSEGLRIAWWARNDDPRPGEPRVWQPGEEERLEVFWPFVLGPIVVEGPKSEQVLPEAPHDGYRVDVVWRNHDQSELFRKTAFVEWIPGNRDDWLQSDSVVRFYPHPTDPNDRVTAVGILPCGATPAIALDRTLEWNQDGGLRVFIHSRCGPWAKPDAYFTAIRLPRLEPGNHLVEFYPAECEGDPTDCTSATATLVVPDVPSEEMAPLESK